MRPGQISAADLPDRQFKGLGKFDFSVHDLVKRRGAREKSEYSFARAVGELIRRTESRGQCEPRKSIEFEVSDALCDVAGVERVMNQSIIVPTEILFSRDLVVGTDSAGGYFHEPVRGPVIDTLRERSIVSKLGATVFTGMSDGEVHLPRITTGSTGYWITEGSSTTESDVVMENVVMSPKTVTGFMEATRRLLIQSDANIVIQRDLTRMVGAAIDRAALQGSGASGEPLGLVNTPGVNAIAGASLAWPGVLDAVASAGNADLDVNGYAVTPDIYKLLASREKAAGSGFILENGRINGRPAMHSRNVPAASMVAGPWEEVWIGEWGAIELWVDPFTKATQRIVGVHIRMDMDVVVRYPGAFSVASSIT